MSTFQYTCLKSTSNEKSVLRILLLENVFRDSNQKLLTLRVLQILTTLTLRAKSNQCQLFKLTSANLLLLVGKNSRFTATTWDPIRYWELVQKKFFNNLASVTNFWYYNLLPVHIIRWEVLHDKQWRTRDYSIVGVVTIRQVRTLKSMRVYVLQTYETCV